MSDALIQELAQRNVLPDREKEAWIMKKARVLLERELSFGKLGVPPRSSSPLWPVAPTHTASASAQAYRGREGPRGGCHSMNLQSNLLSSDYRKAISQSPSHTFCRRSFRMIFTRPRRTCARCRSSDPKWPVPETHTVSPSASEYRGHEGPRMLPVYLRAQTTFLSTPRRRDV